MNGAELNSQADMPIPVPVQTSMPTPEVSGVQTDGSIQEENTVNGVDRIEDKQNDAGLLSASDTPEPTVEAEVQAIAPTLTPPSTSTPTVTPQKIAARVSGATPLPIQSVQQSPVTTSRTSLRLTVWGWATLH